MSYEAFYRKLRPATFAGLVGQDHITRALINQLTAGRVGHAYLFCGTRGTGKTSAAKIFAKAINCEDLRGGEPCGVCDRCREIAEKTTANVAEIDAASNNGVDNVRELREEVKYPPLKGRFKVYIIDEVHMLSAGAFNALLKTLEEPPEHVVFILATTDPQKVPPTIHSRCQRFDFRRIAPTEMAAALRGYMDGEGVKIDDDALNYIARVSDGAMRDALSLLESCSSAFYGETISLAKAKSVTGGVDDGVFFDLTEALLNKNTGACLRLVGGVVADGRDVAQFASEYVVNLRDTLITVVSPDSGLTAPNERVGSLSEAFGGRFTDEIIRYIAEFSRLQSRLRAASNDRVLLESACIGICNPPQPIQTVVQTIVQTVAAPQTVAAVAAEKSVPKKAEKAVPDDYKEALANWAAFCASFSGMERGFMLKTKAGYLGGDCLYVVCDSVTDAALLRKKDDAIKAALTKRFGKDIDVNVVHRDVYDNMHKNRFGTVDDFDYGALISMVKEKINFDITVED